MKLSNRFPHIDLQKKRITVTGGTGFLGRHVLKELKVRGCRLVAAVGSKDYNLVLAEDVKRMYDDLKPDIVVHLAARVGGIGFNQENPALLYYDNIMMGTQLIHEGYLRKIEKFVAIGTICAYPKFTPVPFSENDLWNGYPEETNAPYGLAKKMMLVQSQAYRRQYEFNSIFLLPVNLYGPGDNFDPRSSHVIPALVKKCVDAQLTDAEAITVWGTGLATREFLYVEDAARAIVLATERYNGGEPVNCGTGMETPVSDVVSMIAQIAGFRGRIVWDASRPDGQPRRMLNVTRAMQAFGFKAQTDLREGLQKTIEYYRTLAHS